MEAPDISAVRKQRELLRQRIEKRRGKKPGTSVTSETNINTAKSSTSSKHSVLPFITYPSSLTSTKLTEWLKLELVTMLVEVFLALPMDLRTLTEKFVRSVREKGAGGARATDSQPELSTSFLASTFMNQTESVRSVLDNLSKSVDSSVEVLRLKVGGRSALVKINADLLKIKFPQAFKEPEIQRTAPRRRPPVPEFTRSVAGSLKRKLEERDGEEEDSNAKRPRIDVKSEEFDDLTSLLAPSVKDRQISLEGKELTDVLKVKSFVQTRTVQKFKTEGGSRMREFCPHLAKIDCRRQNDGGECCDKIHFRRILKPHTDMTLGNCAYLDNCRTMRVCKFVHYKIDEEDKLAYEKAKENEPERFTYSFSQQWINCDVRTFDFSVLVPKGTPGFSVVMADPPWDIHMSLPYGTLSDAEMMNLNIGALSTDGVCFLWVTGRTIELGRACLEKWGYECAEELLWIKTNQLQKLIRTGRTGHWLNHSKEHCLIGTKGSPRMNRQIDCDVIVAEVRETSRKPDEVYNVLERLSPGTCKIEIFGRCHNRMPGWVTLGNQLPGVRLLDPNLIQRFKDRYPNIAIDSQPSPKKQKREVSSSRSIKSSVSSINQTTKPAAAATPVTSTELTHSRSNSRSHSQVKHASVSSSQQPKKPVPTSKSGSPKSSKSLTPNNAFTILSDSEEEAEFMYR
eukprot:109254_1